MAWTLKCCCEPLCSSGLILIFSRNQESFTFETIQTLVAFINNFFPAAQEVFKTFDEVAGVFLCKGVFSPTEFETWVRTVDHCLLARCEEELDNQCVRTDEFVVSDISEMSGYDLASFVRQYLNMGGEGQGGPRYCTGEMIPHISDQVNRIGPHNSEGTKRSSPDPHCPETKRSKLSSSPSDQRRSDENAQPNDFEAQMWKELVC